MNMYTVVMLVTIQAENALKASHKLESVLEEAFGDGCCIPYLLAEDVDDAMHPPDATGNNVPYAGEEKP